jgi:eukaryotic-like serine/threonine-protein kinase
MMRRFLRFAVKLLVLILVAMISAVTAMRFAIHGREVVVPKFVGMQFTQATEVARDNGLTLLVEERFYSAEVPDGGIMTQLPDEKVRVRRGGRVRIAVSLGPQRAQIPDVVGQSQRVAEINIRRRGLELGSVALTHIPGAPLGQIIGQNPSPNARGANAPRVNVLVADPDRVENFLMPNLVGRQLTEVTVQVEAAGFRLAKPVLVSDAAAKPNTILRQSPTPGQKIRAGAEIFLDIAK